MSLHELVEVDHDLVRRNLAPLEIVPHLPLHLVQFPHAHQVVVVKLLDCIFVSEVQHLQVLRSYEVLVAPKVLGRNLELV